MQFQCVCVCACVFEIYAIFDYKFGRVTCRYIIALLRIRTYLYIIVSSYKAVVSYLHEFPIKMAKCDFQTFLSQIRTARFNDSQHEFYSI